VVGNNEPDIKDVDVAIVARLIMVPFDLTVAKEDIDPELPRKLLAEAPGILRWALNGLLDVRANGLIRPDRIREKTKDYFASQDAKQSFIDEHIEVDTDPNGKGIDNTTLYRRWKSFAEIHNARPGNINSMGWIAEPTGAVKTKKTKGVIWTGIKFAETPLNDLFNS
jgi:putative DNA primase/helicase